MREYPHISVCSVPEAYGIPYAPHYYRFARQEAPVHNNGTCVSAKVDHEYLRSGEAVTRGHIKVCKALATEGAASPEVLAQRVNGGFTLVHLAAGAGAASTVAWLLERTNSSSVNDVENEEGLSPLHCCVMGGNLNFATIDKLASCGADASAECVSDPDTCS